MYNRELKERFLETYSQDTAKTYRDSLNQISEMEEFYKKDIFNFSPAEINNAFKGTNPKTVASATVTKTHIKKYIEWAIKKGYVTSKNDFTSIFSGDKINDYVWDYANKNSYCSRDRIFEISERLVNDIDKGVLICPLEGISGEKHAEIANLKKTDIDFETGEAVLTNIRGEKRTIVIKDKRSLNILYKASIQDEYILRNGEFQSDKKNALLCETPYIFRKAETFYAPDIASTPVTSDFITSKFSRFFNGVTKKGKLTEQAYIEGYPFLNLTNVFKSGFFDYCLNLEKEKTILSSEDYKNICVRYGMKPERWHSYKNQYLAYKENIKRG